MFILTPIRTLSLFLLATYLQRAQGDTCGGELPGFSAQGQIAYESSSDTCDLELFIEAGNPGGCTDLTYYWWTVQYTDINNVQQNVPSLNTVTYSGPAGLQVTNYFSLPFTNIQYGDPIVATVTYSGNGGAASVPITWTQQPLLVTTNTVATTTVTETSDVSSTSTSTVTDSITATATPEAITITTTVGTSTVTAPTSTTTFTSTITPKPKTVHKVDIVFETSQLSCSPPSQRNHRRSPNLQERQQPGTCYEFPGFANVQTTSTFTTSTSVVHTTTTTTDTITDITTTTVTTTTTIATPTSYDDVTATVTTTPVTTSTVFTLAHRSTTTKIVTITVEIPVFPKGTPCPQKSYGGPPQGEGPWFQFANVK